MKPIAGIALGLCLLASAAGPAMAQTTSTPFNMVLFGVLDVNARIVKNGTSHAFKTESSDGLTSSRIGVRGFEDLGDGLRAGYWLEAPLSADTGTANATRFWNRRSTVSLIDPRLGELRLGRDYTPAFTAYGTYDPFGTNGIGEILGNGSSVGIISALGSGANTLTRSDNQVSVILPIPFGGVYGQLAASPSEGTAGNRYVALRLGYSPGKAFDVSAVYTDTRVADADHLRQMQAGAAYDFDIVKLSGQVVRATFASDAGGDREQRVYQIGANLPFGHHVIRIDFIHGDMSGGAAGSGFADGDDATQVALGYQYNLSKRTALYGTAARLHNKGASKLVVAAGGNGSVEGRNSTGAEAGLRVSF